MEDKSTVKDILGIGISFIASEHLYTFMLSSTFTARNIVREKGDIENVKKDLYISFFLSIIISTIVAIGLDSFITFISALIFNITLTYIYLVRGKLM